MILASKSNVTSAVSNSLLSLLAERAQSYFPDEKEAVSEVVIDATTERLCSVIQRVRFRWRDGKSREVIAKTSDNALSEFHALSTVWPRFEKHSRFRVPKPLDLLTDLNSVVMEAAYGNSLSSLLPRLIWTTTNLENAERYCRDAGEWLYFYHNVDRSKSQRKPICEKTPTSSLSETLRDLRNEGLSKQICAYMETEIIPKAENALREPLPVSIIHGDYKLDNILIGDSTITVLDLSGVTMGASDRDVAAFLVSLLLLKVTRRVPYAIIDRLRSAFMSGYYREELPPFKVLAFLQCAGIADVTLEILRRQRFRIARLWVETVVNQIIVNIGEREIA